MTLDILLNHYLPILVLAGISIFTSWIKFVQLYSARHRYALRTKWFRLIIGVNLLLSFFTYYYLNVTGFKIIPGQNFENSTMNCIILCVFSPFLVNGITLHLLSKNKKQSGISIFQNIYIWINRTIEIEIEKLINQKTIEIAQKMEKNKINIEKLTRIAKFFIYRNFLNKDRKKRNAKLATLEKLVEKKDVEGLILILILDDYCDPDWLEKQTRK